ncbi:hypothetical protein [Silvanigrella sp.]|jgi:hypothetical protein|uniref:hypothetical protein n=1 Tax=Silvanigrella sp. TaxID=2024976 RepID=UPI0037CCAA9D
MYNKIEHKKELNNKLLFQFQDKEIINIVNDAIGIQLNDIEETLENMTTKRGLNNAIGKQLDVIGINKNIPRNIDNDEIYRQEIKNKIAIDCSRGLCNDVILAAELILNGKKYLYGESYPARCEIIACNNCNKNEYLMLKNTVSLGVTFGLRYSKSENPFGYNKKLYTGLKTIFGNNSNKGAGYASIIRDEE